MGRGCTEGGGELSGDMRGEVSEGSRGRGSRRRSSWRRGSRVGEIRVEKVGRRVEGIGIRQDRIGWKRRWRVE